MSDELKKELEFMDSQIENNVEDFEKPENESVNEPGAAAAPVNSPDVIAGSLTMAVNMIKPLYPSLETVYTPEVIQQIAESGCALANKHDWNILGFFAKYMEEITFAAVMIPTAINTYKAIDSDMKVKKELEEQMQEAV